MRTLGLHTAQDVFETPLVSGSEYMRHSAGLLGLWMRDVLQQTSLDEAWPHGDEASWPGKPNTDVRERVCTVCVLETGSTHGTDAAHVVDEGSVVEAYEASFPARSAVGVGRAAERGRVCADPGQRPRVLRKGCVCRDPALHAQR